MKLSVNLNYKEVEANLLEMTRNTVSELEMDVKDFKTRVLMKLLKQHYQNAIMIEAVTNSRTCVKFAKDPEVADDHFCAILKNDKLEIYDYDCERLIEILNIYK